MVELEKVIIDDVLVIEQKRSKITLDSLDLKEEYPKPKPVEKTLKVQIEEEGRVTKIGSLLYHSQKGEMKQFLKGNSNVLAWLAVEMLDISPL